MTKKQRKRKKKQQLKNKKLLERYPWLTPRNRWTDKVPKDYDYSYTELDAMPDGWRKAFGMMMVDEIDKELRKYNAQDTYRIMQIKEKFGCYDDKTEVLTKEGWKFFKDLTYEDKIMTLNQKTSKIQYQYPTDIISEKYKGIMYHLENRGLSLMVTPNHNLYVAKGSYYYGKKNNEKHLYDFELTTPDKYYGKDKRFKKGAGVYIGKNPYGKYYKIKGRVYTNNFSSDNLTQRTYVRDDVKIEMMAWMRFLGFYVAEGCAIWQTDSRKQAKCNGGEICVAYDPRKEEELVCKLIRDIGFEPKDKGKGCKYFSNVDLAEWLYVNCGHMAWNKKVPNFIKTLPKQYIEEFLTYLYIGDGHKSKTSNILTTTSKQLSDDVQELLIKCGYCFREIQRDPHQSKRSAKGYKIVGKHKIYEINWLKLTEIEIDNSKARYAKSFIEEWVKYSGVVYCVTVPNHIIYIRRNGKGVWCGNSLRWYDGGQPRGSKIDEIISKYEYISENVCINCGKPDTPMTDMGWISPRCFDCYIKYYRYREKFKIERDPEYIPKTEDEIKEMYEKDIINEPDENGEYRIRDTYSIIRFSKDGNKTIAYDISDTAEKIRRRYGKRTS